MWGVDGELLIGISRRRSLSDFDDRHPRPGPFVAGADACACSTKIKYRRICMCTCRDDRMVLEIINIKSDQPKVD